MSDKVAIAKTVIRVSARFGVSKVINDVIANNTTIESNADMAKVWVGSFVLGSMIADHACNYTDQRVDAVVEWWNARKTDETKNEYVSDR